jgi:hypothetical protein
MNYGLSLDWVFSVLNPTFNSISVNIYRGGKVYWCRKPEYPEKTTDLPQVTDKLLNRYIMHLFFAKNTSRETKNFPSRMARGI